MKMLKPDKPFYKRHIALSREVIKRMNYENNFLLSCCCGSFRFC